MSALLFLGLVLQVLPSDLPGSQDDSEEIRILLGTDRGSLRVSGSQLELSGGGQPSSPLHSVKGVALRCTRGIISAGAERLTPPVAVEAAGPLRVLGRALRGQVEVHCDGDRWLAINVLPIESYLAAVLAGEMPASFPIEALKAQAVAARSYALMRKIEAREAGRPYHLGATVLSQVYLGLDHEDPRTLAAVTATHGEVLAVGVTPVEAYFHASCGGRTESGAAALDRPLDYLRSASCPCENRSPYAHWRAELSATDLGKAVGLASPVACEVISRTGSGRAARVQFRSAQGGVRTILATQLRTAVGYQKIPSTWFEVHREGNRFVFEGRGSGHGAGLCQWGARIFAEQGKSYRDILEHYYPGTTVERIY